MPRIAIDDFGEEEIARVYFAARLAKAELVEGELNKQSIDYAVEVEPYVASASSGYRNTRALRFM
jgi:hypothetical protein